MLLRRGTAALLLLLLCLGLGGTRGRWCATGARAEAGGADKQKLDGSLLLTTDEFADAVERQESPALVEFFIPDCPACLALAPELGKVASNLKGIATVGAVDCTDVSSVRTCRAYAAHKFPKVLLFKPGSRTNPYTGGAMKEFDEYKGELSARALASAVTDLLDDSRITKVSSSQQHRDFLEQQPELPKVLLFTDKPSSTVLFKGLSWAYARRVAFAEVRPDEQSALAHQYGVDTFPALFGRTPEGELGLYSGPLKAARLREFLDMYALKEPLPEPAAPAAGGPGGGPGGDPLSALFGDPAVQELGGSNLTEIEGREEMWLVGFYAAPQGEDGEEEGPGCAAELSRLRTLLSEVQGVVRFGVLDAAAPGAPGGEQLSRYGVDRAALRVAGCDPQLVLFPHGSPKAGFERWGGGLGDAKKLQEWILDQIPDFTVLLSNEVEAQAFVAAGGDALPAAAVRSAADRAAPVAKVFLFSTKTEVPGTYKALAARLRGSARLLFGWTTPDAKGPGLALMQKMNVRKPPAMAILLPLPAKPTGDAAAPDEDQRPAGRAGELAMQVYMGPLKFPKMLAWLQAMSMLAGLTASQGHAGATPPPTPADFDVGTQAQLKEACYGKPSLCLIALLDGSAGDANRHRDELRRAAAALEDHPLTWVAVDVSRQPSFRRAYGFEADQLPALVALSTKRMRFAQAAAPFGEDSARRLVAKVLAGSAVTLPLPELPSLVDGGEEEAAGGAEGAADAAAAAEEAEFDLTEVMAEEVGELRSKEELLQKADEELQAAEAAAAAKAAEAKKKGKKAKKVKKSKKKKAKGKEDGAVAKDEL